MFDPLKNDITLHICSAQLPFPPHRLTFPEEMLASLKQMFCGTLGLFFQLLAAHKFHPILLPIKPVMDHDFGHNITRDKQTFRSEKVNIQQSISSFGTVTLPEYNRYSKLNCLF